MQEAQLGSSIVVSGAEGYSMEDPQAEMDLLRHEIDISIDQKLRGVEKRLQVSNALSSLKQDLEAQVEARFQNFSDRLQVGQLTRQQHQNRLVSCQGYFALCSLMLRSC